jgi:hypothetical protein
MMKRDAYSAARTISPRLHEYFARHRDETLRGGESRLAPLPDAASIEIIIDAAFWASLRREEGYIPRISLAFLPPDQADQPLLFERPLALDSNALTRVAPAVERPGIHLGVWRENDELCVWGATRTIPLLCFVLEVAAPGLLVIKHHSGDESRKFINVAVLEGDQIKLIEEPAARGAEPTALLKSMFGLDSPGSGPRAAIALVQLAVSMRAHGRGAILLVVPAGTEAWRESIVEPMLYAVSPHASELAFLKYTTGDASDSQRREEAVANAIETLGGLTAVDGALVLNNRYEVYGFGAKIVRRRGSPRVEQVLMTEPIVGARPLVVHPEEIGGTRHLAAAQFVHDQQDAAALVASQDGRFTVFEWSSRQSMVHGHRVETLLL